MTAADREAQLVAALADVERRIAGACAAAGRLPVLFTLVVFTMLFPASDVGLLA